jgi:hypothetical protein
MDSLIRVEGGATQEGNWLGCHCVTPRRVPFDNRSFDRMRPGWGAAPVILQRVLSRSVSQTNAPTSLSARRVASPARPLPHLLEGCDVGSSRLPNSYLSKHLLVNQAVYATHTTHGA